MAKATAVGSKTSAGVRNRPQRVVIFQISTGVTETSAGVKPQQPQRQIEPWSRLIYTVGRPEKA